MCDVFHDLCTPRLRLRRLRPDDGPAICAYRALPEVARYQSWDSFSLDDANRLIAGHDGLAPDTPGTWFQLGIVRVTSGQLIGDCGLHFREDEPQQVELGITLGPDNQGCGLAREALDRVLEYVFVTLRKHRIFAITDSENRRAANLFAHLGFRREGHFVEHVWFKGAWGSEYLFALLRREWEARFSQSSRALPLDFV